MPPPSLSPAQPSPAKPSPVHRRSATQRTARRSRDSALVAPCIGLRGCGVCSPIDASVRHDVTSRDGRTAVWWLRPLRRAGHTSSPTRLALHANRRCRGLAAPGQPSSAIADLSRRFNGLSRVSGAAGGLAGGAALRGVQGREAERAERAGRAVCRHYADPSRGLGRRQVVDTLVTITADLNCTGPLPSAHAGPCDPALPCLPGSPGAGPSVNGSPRLSHIIVVSYTPLCMHQKVRYTSFSAQNKNVFR